MKSSQLKKKIQLPKYVYYCKDCDNSFEAKHSLDKKLTVCKICNGENSVNRIPSNVFISIKNDKIGKQSNVGELVKEAIEETKDELSQNKETLSQRMYKK